ncbi:MAG: HEAT repeat domain-containing protein, partial [Anaerolineae bacterium]|nr:HEAT repeat domain-containing protein [Anaerolineae bacterium]
EEASLKADDRAARIKEYLDLENRARERLAEEQGAEYDASSEGKKSGLPLLRRLLPVYVHLANIDLREMGKRADPAEPLVRAVQHQSGYVTSKTLPRQLYERLNRGGTLVLLDGFDELPVNDQRRLLPWLRSFLREYRKNFVIVAGAVEGFGALTRVGFTPVFLRPWLDMHIHDAAENWANHWSRITGSRRRDNERPAEKLVRLAQQNSRRLTPFELTLRLRGTYAQELEEDATAAQAIQAYLRAAGVEGETLTEAAQVAALQITEGFISATRLHEIISGQPLPVSTTPVATEDDDLEGNENGDVIASPTKAAAIPKKSEAGQFLKTLETMGLIRRYRGDRYLFRYAPAAAYLASLTVPTMPAELLRVRAMQPAWENVFRYAASHTSIDTAVQMRLAAPPNLLQTHLLTVARWLGSASEGASWRVNILKQLGNSFMTPNQYPLVRERIAAGLVGTGDKNALVIFQKALKNTDPYIRKLAALSIGAMQVENALDVLITLTGDTDQEVQLAAVLGLAAIGTDEALEALALTLTGGSEQLQRAAAEAFAAIPEEGYPVLHEAITGEDMALRRAAVFGLKRLPTAWALIAIYRVFLEDPEWYVRSAAQQAFIDLQATESDHLHGYPPVEAIPWLREWIEATRKEGETPVPDQELLAILHDAEPAMQAVSAQAIGQLGMADKLDELYAALLHDDPQVRIAAHQALANLQQQMGEMLPAPVA